MGSWVHYSLACYDLSGDYFLLVGDCDSLHSVFVVVLTYLPCFLRVSRCVRVFLNVGSYFMFVSPFISDFGVCLVDISVCVCWVTGVVSLLV